LRMAASCAIAPRDRVAISAIRQVLMRFMAEPSGR
jgi:hypothetical protein